MYAMCLSCAYGEKGRALVLGLLEMELQTVVSFHKVTGNQTQVFFQSIRCS